MRRTFGRWADPIPTRSSAMAQYDEALARSSAWLFVKFFMKTCVSRIAMVGAKWRNVMGLSSEKELVRMPALAETPMNRVEMDSRRQ